MQTLVRGCGGVALLVMVACAPPPSGGVAGDAAARFVDVTRAAGLPVSGGRWPDGTHTLPEVMQGGIALVDVDGDGDLDVVHVRVPPPGRNEPAPPRLYLQQEDGRFRDATAGAGLDDPGFGQGIAAGDVDNDGDVDLFVTNYGANAFFRNRGDGTFERATEQAGFAGEHWSASAAFCDYDGDGHLDLFVTNYLMFDERNVCLDAADKPDYCGPQVFHGVPDHLYRNRGDGSFEDVTEAAGIVPPGGGETARGLGVACADLTGDGLLDFYVANDGESNQLWVNQGDGTFVDQGILRGVAVNRQGKTEASMGVAVGDVNADGHFDLFMTHLVLENNTLYLGSDGPLFREATQESQMAAIDQPLTGFGCALWDYDLDGDLDVAVANGRVRRGPVLDGARVGRFWGLYAEPNLLFENRGDGTFIDATAVAGPFGSTIEVSRGLATGDVDGDGDPDLLLSNVDNGLRLYRNDAPTEGRHWLRLKLREHGHDAEGVRVTIQAGERRWVRWAGSGSSYASAGDPRVIVGLGEIEAVDEVRVRWSDGTGERFTVEGVDREVTLEKGRGDASTP